VGARRNERRLRRLIEAGTRLAANLNKQFSIRQGAGVKARTVSALFKESTVGDGTEPHERTLLHQFSYWRLTCYLSTLSFDTIQLQQP